MVEDKANISFKSFVRFHGEKDFNKVYEVIRVLGEGRAPSNA